MDRQSLLAFLLIGIIIVFYPWYMSLVAPVDTNTNTEYIVDQKPDPLPADIPSYKESIKPQDNKSLPSQTINIKTNLYDLELSNKNGGSFVSYSLYKYKDHNGNLVNLIDALNSDNLTLGFVSVDGDQISLNRNWSTFNTPRSITVNNDKKTLKFSL